MRDLHCCGASVTSKLPQLLAVFTGTVSAISDGMQYGWASPVIPILRSKDTPVVISESDVVWLESIYMIGGFAGLPITIYCVDKIGRKNSILLAAVQNLVAWILIAVARSVAVLYVARFLTGLAGDVAFVAAPMYIAEIADRNIRGFLGGSIYVMMLIGILVVYAVAPFVSIPVSSGVGSAFLLLQLITFHFMPESPYYLLLKGKYEKARKSLQFLRGDTNIDKELAEISSAVERQKQESGRPIDLLLVKSNRKALIIMTVLNAAQHFSSISVMLMNIHTILGDADGIISPNSAAIVFSVVMIISSSIAALIIDKTGRKILLSTSSLLTGLSLAVLAGYFMAKDVYKMDMTQLNWLPVLTVMVYAAAFKYGLGMVPIVMTGELFPTSVKALGMTLSDCTYVIFAIISIYMYQALADFYGMHVPFFIFAASCILTAIFAQVYIPETKGKTLEEIQYLLKGEPFPGDQKAVTLNETNGASNVATKNGGANGDISVIESSRL